MRKVARRSASGFSMWPDAPRRISSPLPFGGRAVFKFRSIKRLARYPPYREGREGYERGGPPLRSHYSRLSPRGEYLKPSLHNDL